MQLLWFIESRGCDSEHFKKRIDKFQADKPAISEVVHYKRSQPVQGSGIGESNNSGSLLSHKVRTAGLQGEEQDHEEVLRNLPPTILDLPKMIIYKSNFK